MPDFPQFIRNLPAADLPIEGADGRILQGENGQVLLLRVERETVVAEHAHGDQWGIVIDGEMELTMGGRTETYRRGDSYFIPAGAMHGAILREGFRALDVFAEKNRYRTRAGDRSESI